MEGAACPNGSWNAANQQSYKTWVDNFAAGIGNSRVALIVQPDLPFAECAHSPVPLELVNYGARRFNALRHTTVYVDGGARCFPSFNQAVSMLKQAGVRYVRGFSLNTSEYDTTSSEIEYRAGISRAPTPASPRVMSTRTCGRVGRGWATPASSSSSAPWGWPPRRRSRVPPGRQRRSSRRIRTAGPNRVLAEPIRPKPTRS